MYIWKIEFSKQNQRRVSAFTIGETRRCSNERSECYATAKLLSRVSQRSGDTMGIFQSKQHIHNYKLLKSGDRYPISKKVMEFIDLVSPSYICQDKDCRLPMYKCRLCGRTGILEYEAKYGLTEGYVLNHMMSGACVVQISTEDSNEFRTNAHLPHCVLIDKNLGCKCCDMVFDVFPDFLAYKNHLLR